MLKHYGNLFVLIVLVSVSFDVLSQTSKSYYWDGHVKRYLVVDSTEIVADLTNNEVQEFGKKGFQLKVDKNSQSQRVILNHITKADKRNFKGRHGPLFKSAENSDQQSFITDEITIKLKNASSQAYLENKYGLKYSRSSKFGVYVFKVSDWSTTLEIANKIYENEKPRVEWCLPNFLSKITTYADPLYSQQYYLNNTAQTGGVNNIDINAPEAWQISTGCSNIRVAVIDEGIDAHEEFGSRLASGFTAGSFGGTGQPINEILGVTTKSHGVHCAGIIGATHDNNLGMKGIAPGVTLVPVNIFPAPVGNGIVTSDLVAVAIDWAWQTGNADVISNSWGGGVSNIDISDAIGRARTQGRGGKGSIVVFASGNNGNNTVSFPGNVNGVITVGAIDKSGTIWSYSNKGPEMDLVAPSGDLNLLGDVVTTDRMSNAGDDASQNYISNFGGTSAATPQVSAVAALMLSVNPNLTETQVRTILQTSATDMGTAGFDNTFGYGRLNAEVALLQVSAGLSSITGNQTACYSSSPTAGTTYTVTNVPVGATIIWTKSSNLTEVSGQGTANYKVKASSTTTSGMGWVKAQVTNGCKGFAVSRDIWLGKPGAIKILGADRVDRYTDNVYGIHPETNSIPSFTVQGVNNYTWSVLGTFGWTCYSCTGTPITMTAGTVRATMTGNAINACGTTSTLYTVTVNAGGSNPCPGGLCKQSFVVSPNPTSDEILVSKETDSEEITNITLMDSNGGILCSIDPEGSKNTSIPIRHYKDGDYFISITQGGVTQTNKLVIKH